MRTSNIPTGASPSTGPDGERFKQDEALNSAALLLGRKTYQGFAEAWPHEQGPLAEKYNTMPKYVVSGTLTAPEWANTTVLSGDLVAEVTRLKSEISGEISVAGSIQLAHGLLAADLVDEIHLMVSPIILGHGRTLWGGPTPGQVGLAADRGDRVRRQHAAHHLPAALRLRREGHRYSKLLLRRSIVIDRRRRAPAAASRRCRNPPAGRGSKRRH